MQSRITLEGQSSRLNRRAGAKRESRNSQYRKWAAYCQSISVEGNQETTILQPEENDEFSLSPEDESALLESIAEADRGEVIDAWELLKKL